MAKKILVIDDDPIIVKYLVSLFQDSHCFAYRLGLIYTTGIAHKRCSSCLAGQTVTIFTSDLNDEGINLLSAGLFYHD